MKSFIINKHDHYFIIENMNFEFEDFQDCVFFRSEDEMLDCVAKIHNIDKELDARGTHHTVNKNESGIYITDTMGNKESIDGFIPKIISEYMI